MLRSNDDIVVVATILVGESPHGVIGVDTVRNTLLTDGPDMEFITLIMAYLNMLIGTLVI